MSAVLIVLIVFSFVTFIVKMSLDHERQKQALKGRSDNSLTTSELRRLIGDAVDESQRDLHHRIDSLEKRLGPANERPRISEHVDPPGQPDDEGP